MSLTFDSGTALGKPSVARAAASASRARQILRDVFQKSVAILAFLLIWELAPRLGLVDRAFLPPLSDILVHGYYFAASGQLWPHIVVSLTRAAGGFVLGAVIAVPLGILLGWYDQVERYLDPLLQVFRQFNAISLLPVFILFFGVGYFTKVVIIFWVVFWPILLSTTSGVRYVDSTLVKYARSLAMSDWQIFSTIVAPSALPSIISGMRLAATYALLMLVLSEEVGASSGLGYLVENAQYIFGIQILYLAMVVLVLLGLLANQSFRVVERHFMRWKETDHGASGWRVKS
jgi:NitT/TauT family transport system permease protein